jgi:hypothetical protein
MLSVSEATKRIKKVFPDAKIGANIDYRGLYIFQVFLDLPEEAGFDPFFSVNKQTGEVRDFSVITDGNISEINKLFLEAGAGG